MAVSKGRAEFEALAQKNRDTFLKNRGSKSPFRNIDAPLGVYYARIVKHPLGVAKVDKKNDQGQKTGFKETVLVTKLQVSIICSADPTTPPSELEKWKGSAGFIQWYLAEGDDEAMQRYYDVLDQIGVDTNGIVMSERDIQDPENQFTIGQVADYIEEIKPCCMIAIVSGKEAGSKFINYKGHVEQTDVEQLIGRPLDGNFTVLDEEGGVESSENFTEVEQAPLENRVGSDSNNSVDNEVTSGSEDEWEETKFEGIWFNKTRNAYFDSEGNEVDNPNPPPPPKATPPKVPALSQKPPFTPNKAGPAKQGGPAKVSQSGPPKKPGARK